MENKIIDEAFQFYGIDKKYKQKSKDCFDEIFSNEELKTKFLNLFDILYIRNTDEFRSLWKIKETDALFWENANPFVTNLMILMGYKIHKENMEKLKYETDQISSQKQRIRECFLNDLEKRNYLGVRVSQMLWATYFINARIIDVGILQYEYDSSIDKIKIHIPAMQKLDIEKVEESFKFSKEKIKKYFNIESPTYICESWLLSKQVGEILNEKSNIKKFQKFFTIENGPDCLGDILNFVYGKKTCEDFNQLPETTSLQKMLKESLLQGETFKEGIGTLQHIKTKTNNSIKNL